jgi:hypothetical protein
MTPIAELTEDQKAFARAVRRNGGYEDDAVTSFILSDDTVFYNGKWGHYYSSLQDMSNMFWMALEYERNKNKTGDQTI